jgi:hypothetical protein
LILAKRALMRAEYHSPYRGIAAFSYFGDPAPEQWKS